MEIGEIELFFLGHSGFLIKNKIIIAIDPYKISNEVEKADIILLSHSHYDHCSIEDIKKIAKKGTIVICTPDCQSKIMKIEGLDLQLIEAGEIIETNNIKVEAIPAYNKRKDYHPKSEGWIGYVIKIKNTIIYHTGDSDFIPEMQKLSGYGKKENNFIALLPVSGKYVMSAEEAVDATSIINPNIAIPMHYGAGVAGTLEDAKKFVELCEERNLNAKILDKI